MAERKKDRKKKTILYVDDEQWLMSGIVDSLSVDYKIQTASSADEALALLEDTANRIDLILLDIMMPTGSRIVDPNRGRTSGVGFTRLVLQEMKLGIPVVCYSVVDDKEVASELKKLGVAEIVPKSRPPSELEKVIQRQLKRSERG